jgi:hypothetical protein
MTGEDPDQHITPFDLVVGSRRALNVLVDSRGDIGDLDQLLLNNAL